MNPINLNLVLSVIMFLFWAYGGVAIVRGKLDIGEFTTTVLKKRLFGSLFLLCACLGILDTIIPGGIQPIIYNLVNS